jgi:hypothetical protein
VEEREDDVECKKWVLRVLRGDDHCTWSKLTYIISYIVSRVTSFVVDKGNHSNVFTLKMNVMEAAIFG